MEHPTRIGSVRSNPDPTDGGGSGPVGVSLFVSSWSASIHVARHRVTSTHLIDQPIQTAATATAPQLVIAVEATRLAREVRGIGRYVRAILPRLLEQRPGIRLVLFVNNLRHADAVNRIFSDNPSLRNRVDVRPVRELARSDADVFWYPWNVASPLPSRGAVVVTVHDVAPLAFPDPRVFKGLKNLRWRRRYRATAESADVIIADSAFTATEVHRYLNFPHDRMRVVLLAADDLEIPSGGRDVEALERLGVERPFVLAVGAADRRKNLSLVTRAMNRVVESIPGATLVLAGPRGDRMPAEAAAVWRRTLGFVSEEDLTTIYRSASVLVMPSTYEGFGLPVLEAMRLGTPVICARSSSLPEVAGDAAIWIDPQDDVGLASSIVSVLTDERLRTRLSAASLAQASRFSWNETARLTLAAFDDALKLSSPVRRSVAG